MERRSIQRRSIQRRSIQKHSIERCSMKRCSIERRSMKRHFMERCPIEKDFRTISFLYDILASSPSSMVKYSGKKAGCRKDEEDAGLSKRVSALDGSGVRGL